MAIPRPLLLALFALAAACAAQTSPDSDGDKGEDLEVVVDDDGAEQCEHENEVDRGFGCQASDRPHTLTLAPEPLCNSDADTYEELTFPALTNAADKVVLSVEYFAENGDGADVEGSIHLGGDRWASVLYRWTENTSEWDRAAELIPDDVLREALQANAALRFRFKAWSSIPMGDGTYRRGPACIRNVTLAVE